MKKTFILFLIIIIACSHKTEQSVNIDLPKHSKKRSDIELGKLLVENDFLKYADKSKEKLLRQQIVDSFMIYDEKTNRFAHIDAEELAEFSFDFFTPQLEAMLRARNIELKVEKVQDKLNPNDVMINEKRVNLYTENQLQSANFWTIASQNFFQGLNQIMTDKGSNEKFYLLYDGNDLSTFLLTEKQLELIKEKYQGNNKEIPYLP